METLEEKITKLRLEEAKKLEISSILGEIKHSTFSRKGDESMVSVYPKTKEEIAVVFGLFPHTNEQTVIGFAGSADYTFDYPYRVNIQNPCRTSESFPFECLISYVSGQNEIRVHLPIAWIESFVVRQSRHITDSEYHYFIGCSHSELRKMTVPSYSFKSGSSINWYGGDKTQKEVCVCKSIIENLLS
jgi:hypothetical protein